MDLWAEIQSLSRSIPPEGTAADAGVADTAAYTRLKGAHSREVVDLTMQLLAYDLLNGTYWMDVRRAQDPQRNFGGAPAAALAAFRRIVPWQLDPEARPQIPFSVTAYAFLKSNPASTFYSGGPALPQ